MAVNFDNSIISRVQQSNDIVDVVSEHLSLTKKGKEMVGLCPFHTDHKPSMYVNPTKQIFKCFACGAGGDVLKFVQLRENLSFAEAVERLASRAGIKIKTPKRRSAAEAGPDSNISARDIVKVNDWALKVFQANLADKQKGAVAREYINDRQITEKSTKNFSLGFAPDGWQTLVDAAAKSSVPKELLVAAGLVVQDENGRIYDKFRNRLMFTIFDAAGRVIGFGGRTLGDDPAKYMNSPATVLFDKSNCLYGLDKARHEIVATGTAVVVEGYTDVIMAHQHGCKNVVAALGTSFTAGHAQLLRRYAREVVLVFDNDVAGTEAANRALEVCLAQKIDIKLTFVTDGKDPCDFLIAKGKQAFDQIITDAVDVMDYKWQRLQASLNDKPSLVEKRTATEEFLRAVATAFKSGRFDPISEGLLINRLSSIIGMSDEQVRQQIARLARRIENADSLTVPDSKVVSFEMPDGPFAGAKREILEAILNEPSLYNKAAEKIGYEQFDVPVLGKIAKAVFHLMARQDSFELTQLMALLESTEAASVSVQLADDGAKKGNFQERLERAVEVFLSHLELQHRNQIKAGLNDDNTESLREYDMLIRTKKVNKRTPGIIA